MVQSLLQTSFNGGELSARMEGRPDLAAYGVAARKIRNMVVTVQGPLVKRSGTRWVAEAGGIAGVELLPFVYNETQGYVIEAGPGYFRFFTNDAQVESAPGVPYQIATPFLAADLPLLQSEQSAEKLYLVDGRNPHQVLVRTSATTFALSALELKNGPFNDQNNNDGLTVQASAGEGAVTITASGPIFKAGHAGGLLEIECADFASIPAWEPQVKMEIGDKRRSDGKVYEAIAMPASSSKRTGTDRPIHDEGSERDGTSEGKDLNGDDVGGVLWKYLYSRAGIVRITGYLSPTQVSATVIKRLPDEVVASPSKLWAMGAFSNAEGWADAVAIRDERLWLAKGNQLFASVVGDYEDFSARDGSGLAQADLGIRRRLPRPERVRWLANDRSLLVGTSAAEYAVQPVNPAQAVAFNNLATPRQSAHGSYPVRPVAIGTATLFVAKGGRKLRAADYAYDRDRYQAPDVTVRAEHITRPRVTRLAAQMEPEASVWGLRSDGRLVCLTWSDDQNVRGFSLHDTAGTVRSICCIPSPDGTQDQLWLAVTRTIAGVERQTIERLLPLWQEGDEQASGCFVDCSLTYQGAPATVISGLAHLNGQTVTVVTDGASHPDLTVIGGSIELERPARQVHVGLPFAALVESMRLTADVGSGSGLTKIKRVVKLGLDLQETLGIRVRRPGGLNETVQFRTSAHAMDAAPPLFSGERLVGFPGGYDREARVVVESFQALPFTLLSLAPRLEVSEGE
jgi:hypothetical protein